MVGETDVGDGIRQRTAFGGKGLVFRQRKRAVAAYREILALLVRVAHLLLLIPISDSFRSAKG
jgi:hypothetical protein